MSLNKYLGVSFLFTPLKHYRLKGFKVRSINDEFVKFEYLRGGERGHMMTSFFIEQVKNKIFVRESGQ